MKYVYCLASETGPMDGFPLGLAHSEVNRICFDGITALASDIASNHMLDSMEDALIHQEVVQATLRTSASVLPCRFGARFQDERDVLLFLQSHYALVKDKLAALGGKMEVGVHALFSDVKAEATCPSRPQHPTEGTKYLLKKGRQNEGYERMSRRADAFGQEVNKATASSWADVRMQKRLTDRGLLLSLYYLVARENLSLFKATYQEIKRRRPWPKLLYTGPWPPYTFADIDLHHLQDTELRRETCAS